jgi:hypothetical protein
VKQSIFQPAHTESLYNDLRRANTEQARKKRFLQYLTTTFAGDSGAQKLISAMALGAERIIANIPRGERLAKGRADSQTETDIIEWERDLNRTGDHAREIVPTRPRRRRQPEICCQPSHLSRPTRSASAEV